MQTLTKEEAFLKKLSLKKKIEDGSVFIHPTDTIYGLGADARNEKAVTKIRDLKHRFDKPFSVIAPSKEWILENCEIDDRTQEWIDKLPGPYTLIIKLKNKHAINYEVNKGMDTIGVRIPDHWISEFVEQLGFPTVTTSANIIGKQFMTEIDNLDPEIRKGVDFIIYEGEKEGRPSNLIRLDKEEFEIRER